MTTSSHPSPSATRRWASLTAVLLLVLLGPVSLARLPVSVQSDAFGMVDLQLAMNRQKAYEILHSWRTAGRLRDASVNLAQDNDFIIAYVLCGTLSLLGLGLVGRGLSSQWTLLWIAVCAVGMLLGAGSCDYFGENPRLGKLISWAQDDSFADSSSMPVNIHDLTGFAIAKFAMFGVALCLWVALIVAALRLSFLASEPTASARRLRKGDE